MWRVMGLGMVTVDLRTADLRTSIWEPVHLRTAALPPDGLHTYSYVHRCFVHLLICALLIIALP